MHRDIILYEMVSSTAGSVSVFGIFSVFLLSRSVFLKTSILVTDPALVSSLSL